MLDKIYIVTVDGAPYYKENAIRTYKTLKAAKRNSKWFANRERDVKIGELSLTNVIDWHDIKED